MRERNLYKREGVWWLRAKISGVEHRESLRTSDVKVARRRRDARIEEIKAARFYGERKRLWLEVVADWAAHAEDQISAKTAKRYAVSLDQVRPYLEKMEISEIDGGAIADLISQRRKQGITAATVRRDLTAVSRVLEYAEAMGWREGNPTLSKRRILKERRNPIALPERSDIEAYIAAASPQFGALIRGAWLTGCRQDELVTVTWRQFSHNQGTLEVIGKGNKRRVIRLSEAALDHIRAIPRTIGSRLIFCKQDGEPFLQAASDFTHLRRMVMAKAKKEGSGIGRFRFHDLRHLFAVETLRSGEMSIYALSKHLGHTSVQTTEIYLSFLTPEQAAAVKDRGGTKVGTEAQNDCLDKPRKRYKTE